MHTKKIITGGREPGAAEKALIMIHGRGGSAADIMSLAHYLNVSDFALLAPEATNNTWYPQSFLAPVSFNEPWLSSALEVLEQTVNDVTAAGIPKSRIYFLGFSQGACLTLEYVARNATVYGGVVAFTGGLIGESVDTTKYKGDFGNTAIFTGSSNPDAHVPVERVNTTSKLLTAMGASVTTKIYDNMGHTINNDEINQANALIFK